MAGVAPTTDVAKDEANEDDADGVARPIVRIPVMSDDQTPADIELALMESASPTQAKPGGDRLNDRLNEAKRAGRRARFSMSGPPFVIGLLCIGFGCADFVRATSFLGGALMFLVLRQFTGFRGLFDLAGGVRRFVLFIYGLRPIVGCVFSMCVFI